MKKINFNFTQTLGAVNFIFTVYILEDNVYIGDRKRRDKKFRTQAAEVVVLTRRSLNRAGVFSDDRCVQTTLALIAKAYLYSPTSPTQ